MVKVSTFRVTLYNDVNDEQIGAPFLFTALPYPGLRIDHGVGVWEVVRVQVSIPQPGSVTEQNRGPVLVDAMVVASFGVHHVHVEDD